MYSAEIQQQADSLHQSAVVADIHSDIPTNIHRLRSHGETDVFDRIHYPALEQAGVNLTTLAIGTDSIVGGLQSDAALRYFFDVLDSMETDLSENEAVRFCFNFNDVEDAIHDSRIAALIGAEGGACIGESLGSLRYLYRLGVRTITLTWNYRNSIGDGIAEEASGGGLSRFGVKAVKEMQNLGILVDVSHMTQSGIRDVLSIAERPVVASHSNARSVCDHARNIDDEIIVGIAETNGLVGICCYPGFIDKTEPSVERLVDHVDHIVGLVGDQYVAIGADFIDYMQESVGARLKAADANYLDSTQYPEGIEGVQDLSNITMELLNRGYNENSVRRILGENFQRVIRESIE